MNEELRSYQRQLLNQILNDFKSDKTTRDIAKGLFKTSPKSAIDYAEGLPLRKHAEKPIKKFYEDDIKD